MTPLEIIETMSLEHIRKAIKACAALKDHNVEGGVAALKTMTEEELHTFVSFLEAALAEGAKE